MKEQSQSFFQDSSCSIEYELSRHFMNYAKDNLFEKEIKLMIKSDELLETLGMDRSLKVNYISDKDEESFYISKTLDTEITEEDDEPKVKSRPFTRRTANAPSVQPKNTSNDIVLACAIDEIKENCSRKTYSTVNSLLENYNKLQKERLENKEKEQLHKNLISRRSQESNRNSEDQTVNLAAKNMKLFKENNDLLDKIKGFELQITALNAKAKDFEDKYEQISNKGFQYFEQQHQASCKIYESTKDCHEKILDSLQENLIDEGCSKCCRLMKKIKSSLINYKECLSQEIEVYQRLWESQLKATTK